MNGRHLLRNFTLACLILSMIFAVVDLLTRKAYTGPTVVLLFVGLLGVCIIGALREFDERLKVLEKQGNSRE